MKNIYIATVNYVGPSRLNYTKSQVAKVSQDTLSKNRIIAGGRSKYCTAYNLLRTQLIQIMLLKGWNTLGVVSAGKGEGKSLTTINLGLSISREINYTALVVDFDLANPSIHKYFELEPKYGVSDYINSDITLDKILINPGLDKFMLLPGRGEVMNSSESLRSPKITELVKEIKHRYINRLILYDLPPLLSCDDALAFAPQVDAFLFVVHEVKSKKSDLSRVLQMLGRDRIIGTVINYSEDGIEAY